MSKTIVAIATPHGRGGVSIIRISGEQAHVQLDKIFVTKFKLEHKLMCLGKVATTEFEDHAMAVKFFAPQSFTGEDVAEIHCHGSPVLCQGIVQQLINNGCSMAERGDFARRAVLNGKMDLLQAEGIIDRIDAHTNAQIAQSSYLLDGVLSQKVNKMQDDILVCLASCEVAMDYPEEDLDYETKSQLTQKLTHLSGQIDVLLQGYKQGKLIKDGVKVVLAGNPNAGKSSLLNALLGFDRAIVDSNAGTTRDTIRDEYLYKNIKFILSDTAGLRATNNKVEAQGIQRTKAEIDNADIIICLDDNYSTDKRSILVLPKSDNIDKICQSDSTKRLPISSHTGYNIDILKQSIYQKSLGTQVDYNTISNLRHYQALQLAYDNIQFALQNMNNVTLDCIASDIRASWVALKSLTGVALTDDIVDTIFSRFCVGK